MARNLSRISSQTSGVVLRRVMRHAARRGVHARAAERFRIHHLPHRALHQIRPAQSHEAGAFHHDDDVAQRRQIRAARDARSHHRRDLRHVQLAPHQRVVVEDARRAVLAGKNAVLQRQIHAGRIHQIDDRHAIAHRDFLRAQNLGDGLRPPRAGLHRGVVGDHDRRPAFDLARARDHAGRGSLSVVLVVGDQQPDLEKHRAGIEQLRDPLARRQLAIAMLLLDSLWRRRLAAACPRASADLRRADASDPYWWWTPFSEYSTR